MFVRISGTFKHPALPNICNAMKIHYLARRENLVMDKENCVSMTETCANQYIGARGANKWK
jgi:hypothetical protein